MKTAEDIQICRNASARLKKLGVPVETLAAIDEWIDKEAMHLRNDVLRTPGGEVSHKPDWYTCCCGKTMCRNCFRICPECKADIPEAAKHS